MIFEDIAIEMARTQREAIAKIAARVAGRQMGEDFIGLDERRRVETVARGTERREP